MRRALVVLLLGGWVLAACSSAQSTQAGGGQPTQQPGGGGAPAGGGGAALQAAAAKIKDVCPLVPADLEAKLVPGAATPQSQTFPPFRCRIDDGKNVLEVTLGAYDTGGPVAGAESISDLAAGGYLTRPVANDVYLVVLLTPDQGELYVEIVDPSGTDRKNDAIDVAKAVLGNLH